MNKYMDIINYNYTGSKNRKHMSIYDRSAQFAPFAALTGYEDAIYETGRIVDSKIILSEDDKLEINSIVNSSINSDVAITYFIHDKYKEGGAYINYTGKVKKIDYVYKNIIFYDKKIINIEDVIFIEKKGNNC